MVFNCMVLKDDGGHRISVVRTELAVAEYLDIEVKCEIVTKY